MLWDGLWLAHLSMMRRSCIIFTSFFVSQSQRSGKKNEEGHNVQLKPTKIEKHTAELLANLIHGKNLRVQILLRKNEFDKHKQKLPIDTEALIENVEAQTLNERYTKQINAMGDTFYQILCLFGD